MLTRMDKLKPPKAMSSRENRNSLRPSIVAQAIRRAKGFAWDHNSLTFKSANEVSEQVVTSSVPRFHREKPYARDVTDCCWFSPPIRKDQRRFRGGGGNYFSMARVGEERFKIGDFVQLKDIDSFINNESREIDRPSSQNGSDVSGNQTAHNSIGQITCLWEGFPQSAKISRWVEVRWLKRLDDFQQQMQDLRKDGLPHGHKPLGAYVGKEELVLTMDFETHPLQVLDQRIAVENIYHPSNTITKAQHAHGSARSLRNTKFICRIRYDEAADRLVWLQRAQTNQEIRALSPQFNFKDARTSAQLRNKWLPWAHFFRYDVETESGKKYRNIPANCLQPRSSMATSFDNGLPFHEAQEVFFRPSETTVRPRLQVGHRVRAEFRGQGYFCGSILRYNADSTYDVKFDDGDIERKIAPELVISIDADAHKQFHGPLKSNSGLIKAKIRSLRVLKRFKDYATAAQHMFQLLHKGHDIHILDYSTIPGTRSTRPPAFVWQRATVVRHDKGGQSMNTVRVRFHGTGKVRLVTLAGQNAEIWFFAHPAPPTEIPRNEGINLCSLSSGTDIGGKNKFYRLCVPRKSPVLRKYSEYMRRQSNSTTRARQTTSSKPFSHGNVRNEHIRSGGSGRGKSRIIAQLKKNRKKQEFHHNAVQLNDALRRTSTLSRGAYTQAGSAEIAGTADIVLIPGILATKDPYCVTVILAFLPLSDIINCTQLSHGGLRFRRRYLEQVAAHASYLLHRFHFPWPLRMRETEVHAFAYKHWLTCAQACHGIVNEQVITCGEYATYLSSFIDTGQLTHRCLSSKTSATIYCYGNVPVLMCGSTYLAQKLWTQSGPWSKFNKQGNNHANDIVTAARTSVTTGKHAAVEQAVKIVTPRAWYLNRGDINITDCQNHRDEDSSALGPPPVISLFSDGSVFTCNVDAIKLHRQSVDTVVGHLHSTDSSKTKSFTSPKWTEVQGLTHFKRRIVDVAITGAGYSVPTQRGLLLLVLAEGNIELYGRKNGSSSYTSIGKIRLTLAGVRERIVAVTCGYNFAAVLTASGRLRVKGQLTDPHGIGTNGGIFNAYSFNEGRAEEQRPLLKKIRFTQFSAGAFHLLVLSDFGGLFVGGKNDHYQLGGHRDKLSPFNLDQGWDNAVVAVSHLSASRGVKKIAAGGWHSLFLSTTGAVFGCGDNTQGQLGKQSNAPSDLMKYQSFLKILPVRQHGYVEIRKKNSTLLASNSLIVTDISAGLLHSVFKLESGAVLSCGRGLEGQLGHGHEVLHRRNITASVSLSAAKPPVGQVLACTRCGGMTSWAKVAQHLKYKRQQQDKAEQKRARVDKPMPRKHGMNLKSRLTTSSGDPLMRRTTKNRTSSSFLQSRCISSKSSLAMNRLSIGRHTTELRHANSRMGTKDSLKMANRKKDTLLRPRSAVILASRSVGSGRSKSGIGVRNAGRFTSRAERMLAASEAVSAQARAAQRPIEKKRRKVESASRAESLSKKFDCVPKDTMRGDAFAGSVKKRYRDVGQTVSKDKQRNQEAWQPICTYCSTATHSEKLHIVQLPKCADANFCAPLCGDTVLPTRMNVAEK